MAKMQAYELRARSVKELIDSEKAYIGQLRTITKFFAEPCSSEGFLTAADHSKVFGELPVLLQLNLELLSELASGIENESISDLPSIENLSSNQEAASSQMPDLSCYLKVNVGEAFKKIAPFLKTYASYASKYEAALNIVREQERSNAKLKSFLRNTETRPEVQCRLVSLLIAPVQRLPRYKLLLSEILRHTPPGHPFKQALENSLGLVVAAACRVDECVGEGHQLLQLVVLQKALQSRKPRIIAPGRALLKSGLLYKANRSDKGSVARLIFLFTDILMYTKVPSKPLQTSDNPLDDPYGISNVLSYRPGTLTCCCVLPLRHCSVKPMLSDTDSTPVFRLVCQNEDLTLYSKRGKAEGEAWIRALKEAISAAVANRRTLRKDSSAKRPLRRAQLRRGEALTETDTSLQQLNASSPLNRLTATMRTVPTPLPSDPPSTPSESSFSLSGASFRTVSPSPRSLMSWLTPSKRNSGDPDQSSLSYETNAANATHKYSGHSNHPSPTSDTSTRSDVRSKYSSIRSLDAIGAKFSLLKKSTFKSRLVNADQPENLSSPSKQNVDLSKLNSRHSARKYSGTEAHCVSSVGAASVRDCEESPVKIRVLEGSPYKLITRQTDPYHSKWNSGEIGVTSPTAIKEEQKTLSLSQVVKPKLINPLPLKENVIPSMKRTQIPAYCVQPLNSYDFINRGNILTESNSAVTAVASNFQKKRNLRRRSKSCSPTRGFAKSSFRENSTSNIYVTSPHRLARPTRNDHTPYARPTSATCRSPSSIIDFPDVIYETPWGPDFEGVADKPPSNFEESWRREKLFGKKRPLGDLLHITK